MLTVLIISQLDSSALIDSQSSAANIHSLTTASIESADSAPMVAIDGPNPPALTNEAEPTAIAEVAGSTLEHAAAYLLGTARVPEQVSTSESNNAARVSSLPTALGLSEGLATGALVGSSALVGSIALQPAAYKRAESGPADVTALEISRSSNPTVHRSASVPHKETYSRLRKVAERASRAPVHPTCAESGCLQPISVRCAQCDEYFCEVRQ